VSFLAVTRVHTLTPAFRQGSHHILVRCAEDGENIFSQRHPFFPFSFKQPFESVILPEDPTQDEPTLVDLAQEMLSHQERLFQGKMIYRSLQEFRGTLYNGILQANVRPSHGLKLLIEPPRSVKSSEPASQEKMSNPAREHDFWTSVLDDDDVLPTDALTLLRKRKQTTNPAILEIEPQSTRV
jgi:hypothetical protein